MTRSTTNPFSCHRRGFTLTELLIVIGIITLVALLAIPAFRAMTGSRSVESAQNVISAALGRARTEALGLQERRGILFYRDLETGQVGMRMVYATNNEEPYTLDLVPDRDPLLLPDGVGIQFVDNYTSTGAGSDNRTSDGYIGFNKRVNSEVENAANPSTVVPHGGVILFDGRGQIVSATYRFRLRYPDPVPGPTLPDGRASDLGKFLYDDPAMPAPITASQPELVLPPLSVPPMPPDPVETKLGFVLYDAEAFQVAHGDARDVGTDPDNDVSGDMVNGMFDVANGERAEETWLDQNATPVLVNRYNGTLVRAE